MWQTGSRYLCKRVIWKMKFTAPFQRSGFENGKLIFSNVHAFISAFTSAKVVFETFEMMKSAFGESCEVNLRLLN